MTRTGKIARLPRELREQLNCRLQDGEPGVRLVEWLNGLPAVRQLLEQDFGGREINEQNLCEWKQGGFQEWLARQEMLTCARELAANATELSAATEESLSDHLSVILSGRYGMLVAGWNGEMSEDFRRRARALRSLCQDIVELRRGDHSAARLRLDLERFAQSNRTEDERSLELLLGETRQWPDVCQAFRDAFALYKARKKSPHPPRSPESK